MDLNIYLTQRCNFQCKHCLNQCPQKSDISIEKYTFLLDLFKGEFDFIIFMGGEVGLHPHFKEIIDETIQRNVEFSFGSHGYGFEQYKFLLDQKYSRYFRNISFSLDGLEESHDYIRRDGSFQQVLAALDAFTKIDNLQVRVNITLNRHNYNELEELLALLRRYRLMKILIGSVVKNGVNDELALDIEQRRAAYHKILTMNETHQNLVPTLPLYTEPETAPCQRLFSQEKLYFNENGDLIFCCNLTLASSKILDVRENTTREEIYRATRQHVGKTKALFMVKSVAGDLSSVEKHTCEFCNLNFGTVKSL